MRCEAGARAARAGRRGGTSAAFLAALLAVLGASANRLWRTGGSDTTALSLFGFCRGAGAAGAGMRMTCPGLRLPVRSLGGLDLHDLALDARRPALHGAMDRLLRVAV
jgi:hypothetical protein